MHKQNEEVMRESMHQEPIAHGVPVQAGMPDSPLVYENVLSEDVISASTLRNKSHDSSSIFTFKDIEYKSVLERPSDSLRAGQMTAILGPSGAGKTTLLKAISGRRKRAGGTISLDGRVLLDREIRKEVAYVHQETHLIPTLTVKEMMMYTVRLKAPREKNPEAMAVSALETLGLLHIQDSFIGDPMEGNTGISGGERKRLSIAQELISMPGILLLDEPTSGLDSRISESLLVHLKLLAQRGMTVAMTIHQPSSELFSMFDKIIVMRRGSIAFSGSVQSCLEYLADVGLPCPKYTNPPDHIFRVLDRMPPARIEAETAQGGPLVDAGPRNNSPESTGEEEAEQEYMQTDKKSLHVSPSVFLWLRQFLILTHRNLLCGFRNKKYIMAKIYQATVIAFVTGILLYNIPARASHQRETNTLGCFWAVCMAIFGSFGYGSISVLFSDRKIFVKEYTSNYYPFGPYFASKVFVDFIITCIYPFLSVPIIFLCAGIGSFSQILVCVLLGAVAHSLGLFVGSLVDTSEVALAIFPGVAYPINMLTGGAVDTDTLVGWLKLVQYISPTRHAYNIMVKLHYSVIPIGGPRSQSLFSGFIPIAHSVICLIAGYVLFISLAAFSLRRKIKGKTQKGKKTREQGR